MSCPGCGSSLWNGEKCGACGRVASDTTPRLGERPPPTPAPSPGGPTSILPDFRELGGTLFKGTIALVVVAGVLYVLTADWRHRMRQEAAREQQRQQAEKALQAGDPEPMLQFHRIRLAELEQQRTAIERNPRHTVTTNRRSGVETRTEDLTNLLPGIYGEIEQVKARIAELEANRHSRIQR